VTLGSMSQRNDTLTRWKVDWTSQNAVELILGRPSWQGFLRCYLGLGQVGAYSELALSVLPYPIELRFHKRYLRQERVHQLELIALADPLNRAHQRHPNAVARIEIEVEFVAQTVLKNVEVIDVRSRSRCNTDCLSLGIFEAMNRT